MSEHKLVLNAVEAALVREAFELYLEHRSVLTVAQLLNARSHTTKRRKTADGNPRGAKSWNEGTVLCLLRNPLYAGYTSIGQELFKGEHDAIIDRDVYDRVQALLDSRNVTSRDVQRNPAFVLRGILRCAACGAAMTPASNRKNGRVYRYYRCVTRDQQGAGACSTMPLPADAIEGFVVEKIRDAIRTAKLGEEVTLAMQERIAARRAELQQMRQGLPADVQRLRLESGALAERVPRATDVRKTEMENPRGECQ